MPGLSSAAAGPTSGGSLTSPTPAAIVANEPVMTAAFAAGLIVAVANLLDKFGVYTITADQQQAVLDTYPYVVAVVGFVVRQFVRPTAKIVG